MSTFVRIMIFFLCYIPTLVIVVITPYITRKTESFGVTIPEEEQSNSEIKRIRNSYRKNTLLFGGGLSVVALILALFGPIEATYWCLPVGVFLLIFIMFAFYLKNHRQVKDLKEKMNWMSEKSRVVIVDTSFRNKKVMASPLWFLLYIVVIAATAAIGFALYDKIPERMPMHWNIYGEVDRWANKSYKAILWAPLTQVFLMITMVFVYWSIGKSKQVIDPSNPEKSVEQNRKFRYRWSLFTIVMGLVLIIMFGAMQLLSYGFVKNSWIIVSLPVVSGLGIVIATIILSLTTGQGGSRLRVKSERKSDGTEEKVEIRDDDKHWKLGMFYYNPDDPAFIVEKRFGIGWTNNWARPISWVITIGFIVFIIVFSVASTILTK